MSQPQFQGFAPDFHPPVYGPYGGAPSGYASPTHPTWNSLGTTTPAPNYYPASYPSPAAPLGPPRRPTGIGMAATLAVTASLQWVCGLSLGWLMAVAGVRNLSTSGSDGVAYHYLSSFTYEMSNGLAWPLYLFPLASLVLGFLLLTRRQWTRIAFSVTGAAALGWSAWTLRDDLTWLVPAAIYIAAAVLIVWTPAANRWYGWRADQGQVSGAT